MGDDEAAVVAYAKAISYEGETEDEARKDLIFQSHSRLAELYNSQEAYGLAVQEYQYITENTDDANLKGNSYFAMAIALDDHLSQYDDALLDIYDFFEEKINFCIKKNFKKEFIVIDPGIGFGKNLEHNLRIMSKISTFHSLGCPILIGTSRKRFIEHIVTKFDTPDRTGGTLASVLCGLLQGVQLFRVHNVKEVNQGILVFNKILNTN